MMRNVRYLMDFRTKLTLAYCVAVTLIAAAVLVGIVVGRVPGQAGLMTLPLASLSILFTSANGLRRTRAWAAEQDAKRDAKRAAEGMAAAE